MKKDFKIGLLLGLVLVSIAGIWLCVSPTTSVKSRLGNLQKSKIIPEAEKQEPGPTSAQPADSDSEKTQTTPVQKQTLDNKETEKIPDEAAKQEEQITGIQLNNEGITRFHTIRKDETLSDLALQYYGAASRWTKIRDANPKVDPLNLKPGTTLIIPP